MQVSLVLRLLTWMVLPLSLQGTFASTAFFDGGLFYLPRTQARLQLATLKSTRVHVFTSRKAFQTHLLKNAKAKGILFNLTQPQAEKIRKKIESKGTQTRLISLPATLDDSPVFPDTSYPKSLDRYLPPMSRENHEFRIPPSLGQSNLEKIALKQGNDPLPGKWKCSFFNKKSAAQVRKNVLHLVKSISIEGPIAGGCLSTSRPEQELMIMENTSPLKLSLSWSVKESPWRDWRLMVFEIHAPMPMLKYLSPSLFFKKKVAIKNRLFTSEAKIKQRENVIYFQQPKASTHVLIHQSLLQERWLTSLTYRGRAVKFFPQPQSQVSASIKGYVFLGGGFLLLMILLSAIYFFSKKEQRNSTSHEVVETFETQLPIGRSLHLSGDANPLGIHLPGFPSVTLNATKQGLELKYDLENQPQQILQSGSRPLNQRWTIEAQLLSSESGSVWLLKFRDASAGSDH